MANRKGLLIATALVVSSTIGAPTVWAAGLATAGSQLNDASLEAAAHDLSKDYDIPLDEARRRMAMVDEQLVLAQDAYQFGKFSSAGSYIDNAGDGSLVVQFTDQEVATAWSDSNEEHHAPFRTGIVPRSLDYLERQSTQIRQAFAENDLPLFLAEVQPASNRVEVFVGGFRDDRERIESVSDEQMSGAKAIVDQFTGAVLNPDPVLLTLESCSLPFHEVRCDPPLRGGVAHMDADCTTGFRVKSKTDPNEFILSAGHCGYDCNFSLCPSTSANPVTYTWFSSGSAHNIGKKHREKATGDAAILRIDNPTGWGDPSTVVAVFDSDDGYASINETYPINAARTGTYADLPQNLYLCHTGSYTATACGEFLGADPNSQYRRVDYISCGGDSGGPVYVRGYGYGIHLGSDYNHNPALPMRTCTNHVGWATYQVLDLALNALNVELIP